MFISSLLQGDKPPGENWRWVNSPETWDPLHECRPHFRTLESIALFEPEQRGGLGIEPAPKLLDARIRVAGQLYTWGMMHEGSRLMSFEEARRLYPWLNATRIYTLDGGWREVKTDGGRVKIATRAAIDHEGHVLGGRICEEDVNEDNYIAELAAQLDALTDATSRGPDERVILVFDATSPVRAMLRFGRLSARARGDRLAAELLEHFERLRRRVAALVLIWQTSHVGEPVNEWVDVMCDKFGVDDDYPIPRGKVEFASLIFPDHRGPAQTYAMDGMSRVVAQRLRNRVQDTILRAPDEHVQLLGMTPEAQQICDEIASRRCQYVDQPYADSRVRRVLAAEWCPFGCTDHDGGWREIHPSAAARRRVLQLPQLATLVAATLDVQSGEKCLISAQDQQALGGEAVQVGDAIEWRGRWFARAERSPTWWHFHFECTGAPMLAARKSYALAAVAARRCMVTLQKGRELVPHSQLDDLILLIHQGLKGWEAEDGATGSMAQRQSLRNRVQRGMTEAWETELLRAGAAGAIRISGSGADTSGRWRLALTEMVLSGCQMQKLGKEHCAEGRRALWARLGDLRLLGKIFTAWGRALLHTTARRVAALRKLRLAKEFVTSVTTGERRRLRKEVATRLAEIDEEPAGNAPGEWLQLRAWVAWRMALAQGLGRSGKCITHGAARDSLREQLLEASTGRRQEIPRGREGLVTLRALKKLAWRRWLRTGGWAAFDLCLRKEDRIRRNRALAAQRDGMRRWARRADGTRWLILTEAETEERFEFCHEGLRALLALKQVLGTGEWKALGILNLRLGHFIRVGQLSYGPEEVSSCHTLSGQEATEVGSPVRLEIEPRRDPQREKRRRQEVLRSRREVRQRVAMGPVVAGQEADDGGRWAVRRIMAVRRHEGRRGRPLDVLVEWEGEDSDGDLWEESWVSVTYLSKDLRDEARKLESELFGTRGAQAPVTHTSESGRQRQERERETMQWSSRLRDRARGALA